MTTLIALIHFLLALAGVPPASQHWSHRMDGTQGAILASEVVAEDGVARFRCIDSTSGACHYTLYPVLRLPLGPPAPLRRFSVARGGERRIAGLAGFVPCVTSDGGARGPDCGAATR